MSMQPDLPTRPARVLHGDGWSEAVPPPLAGLPTARAPLTRTAELPVSEHAIRVWCAAIGEENPIYRDAAAARAMNLPGVVAPPAMLQTWTMPVSPTVAHRTPTLHSQTRICARTAGYDSVVATNYDQAYLAPVMPGATLTERSWVHDVSDEKQTALGPGRFITIAFEMSDEAGTVVGRMQSRTLYFDSSRSGRARPQHEPHSKTPADGWETIAPAEIPLSRTLIISGALASNDHEAVHLDHELAAAQGLPDIITSIVTTAGLVHRYLGEQIPGPWTLERTSLTLRRPAFPGDTLALRGAYQAHVDGRVDGRKVRVVGDHVRGRHVTASAVISR